MTFLTDPEHQRERRLAVYQRHREHCRHYFDDEGNLALDLPKTDTRSGMFHAFSFLHGDEAEVALANRMIARAPLDREAKNALHKFYPALAAQLLNRHGERLEPEQRERLCGVLHHAVEIGLHHARLGGYNDNHPLLGIAGILSGAAVVPIERDLADTATEALRDTLGLLDRRGYLSEYTSPTYSPISLLCFAEIVAFCPHDEAVQLAAECERRLWLELASHWHPPTCSLAGPHSRAYQIDLLAHFHNAHALMYLVFGEDAVPINPFTHLLPYYDRTQVRHHFHDEFVQGATMWHLTTTYHPPEEAVELAWNKPSPTTVIATSEFGEFPRNWGGPYPDPETPLYEFPAGHTVNTTYLTDRFALGTSRREFLQGGPDTNVHLAFARNRPAKRIADLATLFPVLQVGRCDPTRDERLNNRGRAITLQHEGTAMSLQRPRVTWGHGRKENEPTGPIEAIQLTLLLTCFHDRPEELRLGERAIDGLEGESDSPVPIFLRDHGLFAAIHPLLLTNHGREAAVRTRLINGFLELALVSYEGEPRTFTDFELCGTLTGFVLSIADAEDGSSFDGFCEAEAAAEIHEHPARPSRRKTTFRRGDLELAMELSPISEGIKHATIHGRLAPEDRFSVNDREVRPLRAPR